MNKYEKENMKWLCAIYKAGDDRTERKKKPTGHLLMYTIKES